MSENGSMSAPVHAVVMRAAELLEAYPNEPCEHCDTSVGWVCEECRLLQMICDLRNELNRVDGSIRQIQGLAAIDADRFGTRGFYEFENAERGGVNRGKAESLRWLLEKMAEHRLGESA